MLNVYRVLLDILTEVEPKQKLERTAHMKALWDQGTLMIGEPCEGLPLPGRPERPKLVPPLEVPRRRLGSDEGKAALMHAVAHIEFNAINLALDMALRFGHGPEFKNEDDIIKFLGDWISVAADEARHFQLISDYLETLGYAYGDFKAHNGLWEAAKDTNSDVSARLAIAPMVLEARGLDVTPQMIERFRKINDPMAVTILSTILEEEVPHVACGTKWFHYFSAIRGKDSEIYFQQQVRAFFKGKIKPPFNVSARKKAGLLEEYYLPLI